MIKDYCLGSTYNSITLGRQWSLTTNISLLIIDFFGMKTHNNCKLNAMTNQLLITSFILIYIYIYIYIMLVCVASKTNTN